MNFKLGNDVIERMLDGTATFIKKKKKKHKAWLLCNEIALDSNTGKFSFLHNGTELLHITASNFKKGDTIDILLDEEIKIPFKLDI